MVSPHPHPLSRAGHLPRQIRRVTRSRWRYEVMPSDTKARVHQLTSATGQAVAELRFEGDIANTSKDAVLGSYQSLSKETVKLVLLDFTKVDYINSSGIALIIQMLIEASNSGPGASRRTLSREKVTTFGLSQHFTKVFTMV